MHMNLQEVEIFIDDMQLINPLNGYNFESVHVILALIAYASKEGSDGPVYLRV